MKIRIKDNSIRFRLSQNEINELCHQGKVNASCRLSNTELGYQIIAYRESPYIVEFKDNSITLFINKDLIENWESNDIVGFDGITEEGTTILIEKDFQCLKPRPNEDESNLFPNPQALT